MPPDAPTELYLPADAPVAVYDAPRGPFTLRRFPLAPPVPGGALVRVRLCTICRSDVHSHQGHRPNPVPGVLGHEIVGRLVALGEGLTHDMRGLRLRPGDRITWSEYFTVDARRGGDYHADLLDLPQKSAGTEKYGHLGAETPPHHHGGFGQYCQILPRSWILRVPDVLSDEEAAPINCGVATAVALVEATGLGLGGTLVVHGLGLLGLMTAAVARSRGARRVIGIDHVPARRALALRFGCDEALDPDEGNAAELSAHVRAACPPDGVDAVIEACGDPGVVAPSLAMLRTGGTCVVGGTVSPGADTTLDMNLLLRRLLTLRGVHNYHPRHLAEALDFVTRERERFPFASLVEKHYPLDKVGDAMRDSLEHRVLRAAIVP